MCGSSLDDLKNKRFYTALVAEVLGTFILVLVACGSCGNWGSAIETPTVVQISLCFGLSVGTIAWSLGHVSGGHLNPAVTIGFLVTRKISIVRGIFYMVAQVVGSIAAAGVLKLLTPKGVNAGLGTSTPGANVTAGQVFGVELLIAFILVFTVFATCDGQRGDHAGSGALAIGLSLTMCHLWAVPYTGSGMNPARVFGPALISSTWTHHWAYWAGPLLGGVLAALLYDLVFAVNATTDKLKGFATGGYQDSDYNKNGRTDNENNANNEEIKLT